MLPDGRVMAVWFSSPSGGGTSQRIMQVFSSDQGRISGAKAGSILNSIDGGQHGTDAGIVEMIFDLMQGAWVADGKLSL